MVTDWKVERSPSAWKWDVRFWILPVGIMKIIIFRNMKPCSLINKYGNFFPSFHRWLVLKRESHLHPKMAADLHWNSARIYKILECRDAKVSNFSILGYRVLKKKNWNNCWGLITLAFWVGIQSKEQLFSNLCPSSLHAKWLDDLYTSPNIIWVTRSKEMQWATRVARMGEMKAVCRVLVGKYGGKRLLGRHRRR
jgi:hypothetical protein